MTIRFTATSDDWETQVFRTEDDFIAYLDTLWQERGGYSDYHRRNYKIPRFQARCLRDREPTSYPCVMLVAGERELYNGQDEIQNIFLYDVVIHDDEDEELEAA